MIDDNRDMIGKVAQFETDYWQLDGSFILPKENSMKQYGLWSRELSDDKGDYAFNLLLSVVISEAVSIPGITITFDNKTDNYPVDFDISFYSLSTLVHIEQVRGNNKSVYSLFHGVDNLTQMTIAIHKTSKPNRRLRVTEIDFGVFMSINGDNLFSSTLVTEFDPTSRSIPENELTIKVYNDGRFDFTNPDGFMPYLQERQSLIYRHNLVYEDGSTESVDMGAYALKSWSSSDTYLQLVAQLDYSVFEVHPFYQNSLIEKLNAGEFLELIFRDAGWVDYEIDSYLYDSPPMTIYSGNVTNKEAMRQIAQAAGAVVIKYPDRSIKVTRIDLDAAITVDKIDFENSFEATHVQSHEYYNAVALTGYTLSYENTPDNRPIATYIGKGAGRHIIPHSYPLYKYGYSIGIENGTMSFYESYVNYSFVDVTTPGDFTITVQGTTPRLQQSVEIIKAPWYKDGDPIYSYNVDLPMLIRDARNDNYAAVRDWVVAQIFRTLELRIITESMWRQNPALNVGDYVDVQTNATGNTVPIVTYSHLLEYKGGMLRGKTYGLGKGLN